VEFPLFGQVRGQKGTGRSAARPKCSCLLQERCFIWNDLERGRRAPEIRRLLPLTSTFSLAREEGVRTCPQLRHLHPILLSLLGAPCIGQLSERRGLGGRRERGIAGGRRLRLPHSAGHSDGVVLTILADCRLAQWAAGGRYCNEPISPRYPIVELLRACNLRLLLLDVALFVMELLGPLGARPKAGRMISDELRFFCIRAHPEHHTTNWRSRPLHVICWGLAGWPRA